MRGQAPTGSQALGVGLTVVGVSLVLARGRGGSGLNVKIEDSSAFPTLGGK